MSVFSQVNIEKDISKLQMRESLLQYYRNLYGNLFVDVMWDDPNDPFCYTGRAMFKTEWPGVKADVTWYGPYGPVDDRSY